MKISYSIFNKCEGRTEEVREEVDCRDVLHFVSKILLAVLTILPRYGFCSWFGLDETNTSLVRFQQKYLKISNWEWFLNTFFLVSLSHQPVSYGILTGREYQRSRRCWECPRWGSWRWPRPGTRPSTRPGPGAYLADAIINILIILS